MHLSKLLISAVLITTGLVATSGLATASESEALPSLSRLLEDCNARTGLSGAVTDGRGQPVAGAAVMLHAEPDPSAFDEGERARLRLLGWTRTDSRGCYVIPLYPSKTPVRITLQREGSLEIVTTSQAAGGGSIHQSFGLQADRERAAQDRRPAQDAVRVGGLLGTVVTAASEALERRVGLAPDTTAFDLPGDRPLLRGDVTLVKVYDPRPVLVGQWFSSMKGVRQVWKYAQGASTTMTSAFSTSGRAWSYSRSTAVAKTTDASVSFPVARGKAGNYYRTYFRYAKYLYWYCDGVACGPAGYKVSPRSWERGTQVTTGLRVPAVDPDNCSPYKKGSIDNSRGSRAVTWANGVSIGGDLLTGLGLNIAFSSQTGFTSSAENVVTFGKRGWLCGVFDSLSGRPGMLVARQFARR